MLAANAMGMLHEKANPSTTCGQWVTRFISGYTIASAAPATDSCMVSGLVNATSPSATASSNRSKANASLTVSAPVTRGLSRVRST